MFAVNQTFVNVTHFRNVFDNVMMKKRKRNLNLNQFHKILIGQNYQLQNYVSNLVVFYLQARKEKKVQELEDELRDEDFLFKGEKLSRREEEEIKFKKLH